MFPWPFSWRSSPSFPMSASGSILLPTFAHPPFFSHFRAVISLCGHLCHLVVCSHSSDFTHALCIFCTPVGAGGHLHWQEEDADTELNRLHRRSNWALVGLALTLLTSSQTQTVNRFLLFFKKKFISLWLSFCCSSFSFFFPHLVWSSSGLVSNEAQL